MVEPPTTSLRPPASLPPLSPVAGAGRPEPASKTELMRSLGQLIRGLSAIFWGLPLALVVSVQITSHLWLSALGPLGCVIPALIQGVLWYGLWLMRGFQKQERVWMLAVERAQVLAVVNVGLAPFLYWHQRLPEVPLFSAAVALFAISSLFFLLNLNQVLRRLAALLPDETLRTETAVFTSLNAAILVLLPLVLTGYLILARMSELPRLISRVLEILQPIQFWLLLLLALLPIAVTMSLTWKIKEILLASVFGDSE